MISKCRFFFFNRLMYVRPCKVFVCLYLYFYANRLHSLHPPSASRSGGFWTSSVLISTKWLMLAATLFRFWQDYTVVYCSAIVFYRFFFFVADQSDFELFIVSSSAFSSSSRPRWTASEEGNKIIFLFLKVTYILVERNHRSERIYW